MKHLIITLLLALLVFSFSFSVSQLCYLCVLNNFPHRGYDLEARPPEDHSHRESHSTLAYTILYTFTHLLCFVLFCFALFPIQGLCQFGSRSPSPCQNMLVTGRIWKHGLQPSVVTDSLLPKAAKAFKHQTQGHSWMTT